MPNDCQGVAVTRPLVSGIFVALLLLLVAAGYVSGNPMLEVEMAQMQRGEIHPQDAHLAYYEEHLVKLGIDRLNCR